MELSFSNYSDPMTNGSQMGTFGYGANNLPLSQSGGGTFSSTPMPTGVVAPVSTPTTAAPAAQQGSGFWSKDGGAGLLLGGVQVLGNLWNSYQANKIAREQMGFAREQWNTNLENQTQTYNTALEDRIRARHFTEGKSSGETQAYLDQNKL